MHVFVWFALRGQIPRPAYPKIAILDPKLLKRMLAIAYMCYPDLLKRVPQYMKNPANVDRIMAESGIAALTSMPPDKDGMCERLTLKSMRSISASILPMLHEHKTYLAVGQSSETISSMQLGHGAPGPTSKRYLCNLITEDDVPACYPKQVIVLDLDGT